MKKWMLALAMAFVFAMVLAGCEKKNFSMDQVDTRAYITSDGDLYVEELFTYTFHGSFQGTTRYVSPGEKGGIEFFEAYVPPQGKRLGEFSYENLERLNVEWEDNDKTYYIYNAAKDEVKQVYYRYRINQAAVKYSDLGKLDWSFFKKSNQDIGHVTVDVFLPSGYNQADVHAFLHDRTGGKVTTGGGSAVHYENPKLSEYGNAELMILFPQEQLSQMTTSSDQISLKQLLASEQKREERMQARDVTMRGAGKVMQVLTLISLLGSVMYLLSWKKILAWFSRSEVSMEELEQIDPLLKTYYLRKGKLKQKDFVAGLISLKRRGLVTVQEISASKRFLEEPTAPDTTLQFTYHGTLEQLNEADRHLIHWLFSNKDNTWVFHLDSVAGPTFKEKERPEQMTYYQHEAKKHKEQFKEWKQIISNMEPYSREVRVNRLLVWLVPLMVIIHYALLLYLLYADVASRQEMILAVVIVGIFGVFTCLKHRSKLRIFLFFVACLFVGSQLTYENVGGNYFICIFCSILIAVLVPRDILSGAMLRNRYALTAWRKKVKKGDGFWTENETDLERNAENAVLIGMIPEYMKNLNTTRNEGATAYAAAVPILFNVNILSALQYTQSHLNFTPPGSSSGSGSRYFGGRSSSGGGGTGAF
ncbi:DUF2207 domain-containing protein [Paenibacillus sp.]|jgi:uncharacterized membrane protein YgcG|uniref:DUF2207 domain-containing protein n=1 Tax=Paenibacillus sp. TaxID=58172 RepID=UPI002832D057|nr:DUF2207 domain-containing protein [Paenibacillus sp.]MDR0270254.1 DUF2207 domain-containing protein [Paenibacillus sp.]